MRYLVVFMAAVSVHAQFLPVPCFTTTGPCAGEITQVLNEAHLALQVAKTILILEDALKNSKNIGTPGNSLGQELSSLNSILTASQGFNQATGDLLNRWGTTWTTPPTISTTGFQADFAKWARATQSTLQTAMVAGQLSHVQQASAVGVLTQIEGLLSTLDGRLGAAKMTAAGTQRTAATLEKMHDTMLSQGSAQQVYMQYQLQKDMGDVARTVQFFGTDEPTSNGATVPLQVGHVGP